MLKQNRVFFVIFMLFASFGLTACDDSYSENNIDENLGSMIANFNPSNCYNVSGRGFNYTNCNVIMTDEYNVEKKIEFRINSMVNDMSRMRNYAYNKYILTAMKNSNSLYKNCEKKTNVWLKCGEQLIDYEKLYFSIFDKSYVFDKYKCNIDVDLTMTHETVDCAGQTLMVKELSKESFFNASEPLLITNDRMDLIWALMSKRRVDTEEFQKYFAQFEKTN